MKDQQHGAASNASIIALPPRSQFRAAIETAAASESNDGARRIKGLANTFSVMRSGRLIHPDALNDWLKENGGQPGIPILANHGGWSGDCGFATIGVVESVKVTAAGMQFTARLASGVALADEAWELVTQKMLATLSLGWAAVQARWVSAGDKDIDPYVEKQLKKSGRDGAYVFFGIEPLEISLVDVPDDGGARLAADVNEQVRSQNAEVKSALAALTEKVGALGAPGKTVDLTMNIDVAALVKKEFESRFEGALNAYQSALTDRLIETMESLALDRDGAYGAALLDEDVKGLASDGGGCGHARREAAAGDGANPRATPTGPSNVEELRARLAKL